MGIHCKGLIQNIQRIKIKYSKIRKIYFLCQKISKTIFQNIKNHFSKPYSKTIFLRKISKMKKELLMVAYIHGAVIMENGFTCMSETDALGTDCNQFIEKCNSEIELVNHLVTNICAQTCCLHNQKL